MTTRQPYRPKYIPLYAARTEKKDIEPPALKLEQQDISELRQQIDNFREEIRTSPVSYPKQPMADPHRRFAIPTDLSRFERLRRGLRREEDADINLGANYSRYRLETRRNMEEEEVSDTGTTRVSKRGRDHNEPTSQTRLRSNSRSRNPPPEQRNNLHAQLDDDFEEEYPEIKHESDYEDASMPNPIPQLRRYAGYNAFTGSPQKKVTIREPEEETQEKHTRPRSRSSDSRAEARVNEATRLVEEKLGQYMGAIEANKGPEVAQQFVREYQLMMDLLSEDYQGLVDAKQKHSAKSASKAAQKPAPKPAAKSATTKKGIIKKRTQSETRKSAGDVFDYFGEEDIKEDYEDIVPPAKLEEQEENNELGKDYRRAQESMHELEKEFKQTLKPRDQHTSQKLDIRSTGFWIRTRSTISRSYRVVAGAWYTTTSPLLLLATSFFFWQAIRLYVYASLIIFPLYLN